MIANRREKLSINIHAQTVLARKLFQKTARDMSSSEFRSRLFYRILDENDVRGFSERMTYLWLSMGVSLLLWNCA
jgi:hypothetical protein